VTAEFDSFYLVNTYVPNSGDGLKRLVIGLGSISITILDYFISCTFIILSSLF
jgi:exodeoxyribonuclease-3